ncbi:hypothetical protein PAAG_03893 [Paracoccidioides lutzii Pb01]|uniref:PQ loop repeat protein n=1 Tax=Paracoccidioides lutzii (strain ATCC MYA-826 / Pb01) TaxID=502779 RepID=C1GZE9_PARBA|nr:hypothetical protein PAAG_03893 [Paracoccidioides lutzii Pb01]EEH41972.2 hypothetical protein PAAG_03893 [Paracoccidioides lutzii Pb01]
MAEFPYVHTSVWSLTLHWLLVVAIALSYIPQYIRIKTRQSTRGISPFFVLFRSMSATCVLAMFLPQAASRELLHICQIHDKGVISAGRCLLQMTDHWQLVADWIGAQCFLFIYLYYQNYGNSSHSSTQSPKLTQEVVGERGEEEGEEEGEEGEHFPQPSRTLISKVTAISIGLYSVLLPSTVFSIDTRIPDLDFTITIASVYWLLGMTILSAILSLICYMPQLYPCMKSLFRGNTGAEEGKEEEERPHSLSPWTTGIQSIVYILLFVAHIVRYWDVNDFGDFGDRLDLNYVLAMYSLLFCVWIHLVIVALQQGLLLSLWGYFYYRDSYRSATRKRADNNPHTTQVSGAGPDDSGEGDGDGDIADERTPLLS